MRRGYIRLSKAGPSLESQQAALRSAGLDDFSEYGPVYVDQVVGGRRASELPERENAVRSLEPGDELVVSSAARLGTSVSDVVAVLQEVGRKDAAVFDVETGAVIRWHPDALQVIEYAQRADSANRKEIAEKMRQKRVATGRLGGAPGRKWKVSEKRAQELWDDLSRSNQSVAEEVGTSVPTLYRRLGERGAPRGGGRKAKPKGS